MAKQHSWEPEWLRANEPLGQGKQGRTYLARRSGHSEEYTHVMKLLLRTADPGSRARMFREATFLEIERARSSIDCMLTDLIAQQLIMNETDEAVLLAAEMCLQHEQV